LTSSPRASKKPRGTWASPIYQHPNQLVGHYTATSTGTISSIDTQYTRNRPPHFQASYLRGSAPTNAQITAHKEGSIANAWLQEWQKSPEAFGPCRPLFWLNKPAFIDLACHSRKTNRIQLGHWDRHHEPIGRKIQRLQREKNIIRKKRQALQLEVMNQEERRKKVKQAVRRADVIDLTTEE
ncbi:hypothetical protein BDW02DRAFT_474279, partial [Decorospora gaudefroyi]